MIIISEKELVKNDKEAILSLALANELLIICSVRSKVHPNTIRNKIYDFLYDEGINKEFRLTETHKYGRYSSLVTGAFILRRLDDPKEVASPLDFFKKEGK